MADQPQRQTLTLLNKGQIVPNLTPAPELLVAAVPSGKDITYLPSPGDLLETKWRGVVFKAGTPVRVTDLEMIEKARANPFFRIGSEPLPIKPNAPPVTAAGYRSHLVAWLGEVRTLEGLVSRWVADRNLRASCEVGSDDTDVLGPLLDQKAQFLAAQDGLNAQRVAQVWIAHGIFELPWRK